MKRALVSPVVADSSEGRPSSHWRGRIRPYVLIARPDHWFKNGFMVLGVILAGFYHPDSVATSTLAPVFLALAGICLIASSNYVLNEILDAPTDRHHPVKRSRPIPAGRVRLPIAYLEWLVLGAAGVGILYSCNPPVLFSGLALWCLGLVYNVPPVRSKDFPYLDVLTESVNNPLRLLVGWFAVSQIDFPSVSLLISYWMLGAFLMATKRFAEYRSIADSSSAGKYRRSFKHYDENKLLCTMFFYTASTMMFLGFFILRYHLELLLSTPLIAGFFAYYILVGVRPDSPVQNPERLYREKGLMLYLSLCLLTFCALMFIEIPALYELFHVGASSLSPLWRL